MAWINNPHLFPVFWYWGRHFGGIWREHFCHSFGGNVVRRAFLAYHFTRQSFYLKNSRCGKKTSVSVFASVHLSSILNLSFVSHFLFVCVNNLLNTCRTCIFSLRFYMWSFAIHWLHFINRVKFPRRWRAHVNGGFIYFRDFGLGENGPHFGGISVHALRLSLLYFQRPSTWKVNQSFLFFFVILTHSENQLPSPSAEKSFSVQSLLRRIQDLESNMLAMKEKMVRFSYRL